METEIRVDDLVDRWEEMRELGTPPSIEALCAGSPALAAEVRRRIEALQAMDSALDTDVDEPRSTPGDRDRRGAGPDRGPPVVLRATAVYHPLGHHGHGGLGVVFTAHQEELDRTVALKRIRPDKFHDLARRRFLREAALTARLQHPGIVPIYGLGHDDGGPFYTMPFIKGQTLQEAVEAFHGDESLRRDPGRQSLQFRGLLQRFITACNTMAYAHDQGVVHRDLKPSNLMLGPYGETLVMDWGLAKRFGPEDAAAQASGDLPSPGPSPEDVTTTGEVLGTPQYMSPEQARGEPAGPAGDVFSLGLVLYAILTGKSAYEESSWRGPDRLKAVREASIVPPRRRIPRLPRALEAICLKALAARAEDRYASARALGDDLMRWLADEPVTAWREPISIRARRWGHRHRTAMAAALMALVAGVIGLGTVAAVRAKANDRLKKAKGDTTRALEATRQAQGQTQAALEQSEESRKQAEAVSKFLVEAFRSPDPSVDKKEMKVAEVLDRASARLDGDFAVSRATRGALLDALGQTYSGLGLYDKAVDLHRKALDVREAAMGPDNPATLASRTNLANSYLSVGRLDEAIQMHERILRRRKAALGPDHPDTLGSCNNLAIAYDMAGRLDEAIKLQEQTLELKQAKLGADHPSTLRSRRNLATVYLAAGRTSEAIVQFETLRNLLESNLGPDHPATLMNRNNLAAAYLVAGRVPEAVKLHEATLERLESKLGRHHPHTLMSRTNLATAYQEAGRTSRAIELLEETIEQLKSQLGPDHSDTLGSQTNLAIAFQQAGRTSEAIALHEATLKRTESRLAPDHPSSLISRINLATAYQEAGRTSEAIDLYEATLKLLDLKLGTDHPNTLATRKGLAAASESLGRWARAEGLYRDVLARRRKVVQPDSLLLAGDLSALGHHLLEHSRWSEAEPLLRECLAIREESTPDDWRRYEAMSLLGGALLGQGRHAAAEVLIVAGYEGMKGREPRITVPDRSRLREAAERVVRLYEGWGQPEKADAWKVRLGIPDLPADVFSLP